MYISCFTGHVLAVAHTPNCFIELGTTEARRDGDGFVHPLAQGFKNLATEVLKVGDLLQIGKVGDAKVLGG